MSQFTNLTNVPLSVAVYLAMDFYDYVPDTVSATALLRPVRQRILAARVPADQQPTDILNVIKSRIGTSIHDGVEKVWVGGHYQQAMKSLGYPQDLIDRVVVNPEGKLPADAIPVYLEKRSFKSIDGVTICGKFDFVANGGLEDFKSTSTFTWVKGTKEADYKIQGSIYRWLNQDIITQDYITIQFFFTDFMQAKASDPNYPNRQVESLRVPLMSIADTETYIRSRIALFNQYRDSDDVDIPECDDKELWRKEAVFKYYKNPSNTKRSTKNFDTSYEAHERLTKDGSVGLVKEVPGQVIACKYCAAFPICNQKDHLIATGSLIM